MNDLWKTLRGPRATNMPSDLLMKILRCKSLTSLTLSLRQIWLLKRTLSFCSRQIRFFAEEFKDDWIAEPGLWLNAGLITDLIMSFKTFQTRSNGVLANF